MSRRRVAWMDGLPRDRAIVTTAADDLTYNKELAAVVREMRRNPDFARRWREAADDERVVLLTSVALPALRKGIAPANSDDPCFVCRVPTSKDDLVIVVGELRYFVCECCAESARAKVNNG